nr:serine/threonine-protein kinase rio2-like [Dermatophagoides farinae]
MFIPILFLPVILIHCRLVIGAPVSEIDSSPSPSTLLPPSSIIVPTVASVQILSTCQPGQYFKRDCKLYISCENGKWRRNFCPENKYWNQIAKKCDDIHNVPECYEMSLEIQRDARSMMQAKLRSSKQQPQSSLLLGNNPVEEEKEIEYDPDDDNDNDNEQNQKKSKIVTKILEKPYFSSKDYEDYDDDTDDDDFEDEKTMEINQPKQLSQPTKRSHNQDEEKFIKNDIITNDRMVTMNKRKKSKSNYQRSSTMTTTPMMNTYGKICIVRGKQIECHDDDDSSVTTTSSTTTATTLSTTTPGSIDDDHQKSVINKCKTDIIDHNDQRKVHSYSFTIEINIDDRIFERIERFIRLIIYYISFQFM